MRPIGDPKKFEARRFTAVRRVEDDGWTIGQAAREACVHTRTVERWLGDFRRKGAEGLKATVSSGRPPQLSERELKKLETILLAGPLANGFPNDLWTRGRVAEVVHRQFDVSLSDRHVGRILQSLGWSPQKPAK